MSAKTPIRTVFNDSNSPALFNENISNTNVQGFDSNALGDTTTAGTYAVAYASASIGSIIPLIAMSRNLFL